MKAEVRGLIVVCLEEERRGSKATMDKRRAVARISQSMAYRASTQSCTFQPFIQETRYLTTCNQPSFVGHYHYCCSWPETVTKL